jgi:WD40 repeat protein
VFADSYVVKGHKVFVYAPRQWLRKFARPPTITSAHKDGLDEGNNKKEAGILHKQKRASKSAVEIEKQDPLYWPSIIPHDKGFMRDVDLLKRLDRTPLPAERLKLYRVIGCEAKRGGEGEELVFNTDGSLLFIAGKVVVLQDGADKVAKEPASDKASGQRFWRGHDQPVSTVTVAWGPRVPEEWRGILAASGQYQAKNLCPPLQTVQQAAAEGGFQQQQQPQKHGAQTTSTMYVRRKETWPYACVWDSRTLELKGRVGFYAPSFPSDITSLSFSPDGSRLAVLCADRRHTLSVWNWEQDTVIAQTSTHQYPALRVVYNPYCRPFKNGGKELLVTSGRRHIRFWTLQGLEGAAQLTGAPAIEPARVKGGEPKLQMWDTTNGQLPLFSSKDERGSNKAQPGAGRAGEVLGRGGIDTAEGGVGNVGMEEENVRGQGEGREEGAVPLRPQGVCMEEAGSMEFLTQRWAQKRPGFLAGRGTSAILDATETSNRNSGVIYHAHFPDDRNEKVKMIKIADPGKFNSKWEKGTMLNVIKGRPEFDSKGTTKQDITRMERILVSRPFCCQLHGRSGMFELAKIEKYTTKGGIEYEIPADGGKVMELVDNKKLPQQVALEVLAKRGWAKGVVARYKSVQNLTRNKNSLALGGSLQSSVAYNQRLNVPEYITCGGWYTKFKEQERQELWLPKDDLSSGIRYESVPTHYFLAGATDGKIYRYVVDIRTDTAPNVSLEQTEQCHDGPVSAMQVFPDGSFLSGGRDAHLRLWNPEIKIAWTLEKDNMRSEWQLPNPISNFHIFRQEVLGSFEHPRGVDLEQSIIAIMTGNKELHRFPLEPAKYRQLESEWHSSTPFSVVWSWKDALRTYMPGLAIDTTRIHAAAPIRTSSKQSGGGSGGGGTLGGLRSDSHSEGPGGGQLTGLALHPIRDEYAVVINGTTGGGGLGGIQIVSDWEIKSKVNICRSKFLNLEVGALCCDYSVDGSVVGVGLVSGEIVFISSQTASKVHSMSLCASQSSAASPVRKVRFSPCGRLLALALESRDILVLKLRDDQSFSDDSQALKSMMISGTGVGHTEVASGIDWNAKDSPEVPGNFSYVRTSGSCFEIIHWQVNSSGAINQVRLIIESTSSLLLRINSCLRLILSQLAYSNKPILIRGNMQVERVGVKVSMLRDILWQTCTSYVGWEVQGLWTHTKDDLTCIGSTNKVISAPLLSGDKNSEVIRQKKLLVTADEQGVLRYMRYPALGKIDMAEEFAHGSSIAEVRFWQVRLMHVKSPTNACKEADSCN